MNKGGSRAVATLQQQQQQQLVSSPLQH